MKFLILLVVFILSYFILLTRPGKRRVFRSPKKSDIVLWGEKDNHKYDTVANIMNTLGTYRIDSFLMAGSALGAYRNHGWFFWDKDCDIMVMNTDVKQVKRILTEMNISHSYTSFGFHVNIGNVERPYIDIWLYQQRGDKVVCTGSVGTGETCQDFCRVVEKKVCDPMPAEWLYPVKSVPYGPYLLPTARKEYVDWKYGKGWWKYCGKRLCSYYHDKEQFVEVKDGKEIARKAGKIVHVFEVNNGTYVKSLYK
jgi:hypothetical protein